MKELYLEAITEHFTCPSGYSRIELKETGSWTYDLTIITNCGIDLRDVITIEIEIHDDGSIKMDGLTIEHKFTLDWLERLARWKREEIFED